MKILLTTDGSEYSEEAAKLLLRFTFAPDDEITVFHALSWMPAITAWKTLYDNFQEIKEEIIPRILDSTADILRPLGAKINTSFKEDYPDKAILEASEELDVDLIAMGARGIRGIGSFIIGSVTKMVAIQSRKAVLIVKPQKKESPGRLKVLFATDGSVHSAGAGKMLASLPFPADSELTVLHVLTTAFEDIPERYVMEISDRIKKIVADARERELKTSKEIIESSAAPLEARFSKIEKLSMFGDPATEILNVARSSKADIIAVGTSGMRGIRGMMGSVSRYILNHSECSVLIGKE